MKRKVYELDYNHSLEKYVFVYQTNAGKWQKQKYQSDANRVMVPTFSVKKDQYDQHVKRQIKSVNDALGNYKNYNIFVIKQKSQFKDEVKIGVLGAIGFGDKLFRNS